MTIGCGGNSSSSNTPSNIKKFSQGVENLTDAEKLAYTVVNQDKLHNRGENLIYKAKNLPDGSFSSDEISAIDLVH